MKGQTYLILSIIFIIVISIFAVLNISEVEVNYLFWSGSSPLIFVILFSVLLGGILGMIVSSRKYFQLKRENRQLKVRIEELESDIMEKEIPDTKEIEMIETEENNE